MRQAKLLFLQNGWKACRRSRSYDGPEVGEDFLRCGMSLLSSKLKPFRRFDEVGRIAAQMMKTYPILRSYISGTGGRQIKGKCRLWIDRETAVSGTVEITQSTQCVDVSLCGSLQIQFSGGGVKLVFVENGSLIVFFGVRKSARIQGSVLRLGHGYFDRTGRRVKLRSVRRGVFYCGAYVRYSFVQGIRVGDAVG